MGGLLSALQSAGGSLHVFEQAMGVIQNNVANASTAGYVTQSLDLSAKAFQPGQNLYGGVEAGGVQSSRNQFAEQAVWSQNDQLGTATQQSAGLKALEANFDISGNSGIPAALSHLYSAFSAWSTTPGSATAQQQVLSAAGQVTQAFNATASNVAKLESQTNSQLQSTVSQINQLSSQIAQINVQKRNGGATDGGLDASLYNNLEQLSKLASINVQTQSDGTVSVLMGGQTPLVVGETQNALQVSYSPTPGGTNPGAPPDAHIVTASGQDVTNVASQGALAGLLQFRNTTLPGVTGSGTQQGSLNQLAQSVADRVNTLLTNGQISSGPPAVPGLPLFSYAAGSATSVAGTLSLTNITGAQLAAIDPAPPAVANGTADHLARLATPQAAADMVNGMSYMDYYGSIATGIGGQASSAAVAETAQTQLLTQAQNMRSQVSGVSLNDQAAKLLQFQQAYEAASHMVAVISQTLQSFMTAMQST